MVLVVSRDVCFRGGTRVHVSACACLSVCPLALQWVTLEIEFPRSGSAGAARETWQLAALSGGRDQLKAHAGAQPPVLLIRSFLVLCLAKVVVTSSYRPLLQSGIL